MFNHTQRLYAGLGILVFIFGIFLTLPSKANIITIPNLFLCQELILQHNNDENDRYNIVFVPIKFTDLNEFKNMATSLVDFNGTGSISSWDGQLWGWVG